MEKVRKLDQTFIVRHGEEAKNVFEDIAGQPMPANENTLITFAHTDGDDGLCWFSFEEFWVDFASVSSLEKSKLLEALQSQSPI